MKGYIDPPEDLSHSHTFLNVRLDIWIVVLLVCSTLAIYWQVNSFSTISYDSPEYVFDNSRVKAGVTIDNVRWAFTTTYFSNWHPLTWLSHMLDVEMYGLNPGAHHLTSVFLHILNTLLLFFLLRKVSGQILPSAFVAGLFALHPLHIQTVVWIAERKDLLCTLFFFLSLNSYVNYLTRPTSLRYCLALIFFILGLMAKPMIVTLPFILVLMDFWPFKRIDIKTATRNGQIDNTAANCSTLKRLLLEKIPFFLVSFVSSLITVYAQNVSGAVASLSEVTLFERLSNAHVSYLLYIHKTIWPVDLAIIYPHPGTFPVWIILSAALCLTLLSGLFLYRAVTYPFLAFGWLWFLGTLVPVIGIIQVGTQAMADRYTYIPLIGLFICFSWWLFCIFENRDRHQGMFATVAVLILLILSILSWNQLQYWQNGIALFNRAIDITKNNYVAHNNLGYEYEQVGYPEKAKEQYEMAVAINHNFEIAYLNLGRILVQEGQLQEGINHYSVALRINPGYTAAHNNLGNALIKAGLYQDAVQHFLQAIQIDEQFYLAYNNMGAALILDGKFDQAIKVLGKLLELDKDNPGAKRNMRAALQAQMQQEK